MSNTVTIKQLQPLLVDVIAQKLVPMVHGSPGIGKSDIIKSIADKHNLFLIDTRLSQADPTDMNGFPALNAEKTRSKYLPMETFPIEGDPLPDNYKGWLLFFDEFNSAPHSVQAATYKIVLDRQVGNHNLHNRVYMICAGNKESDKAIVNRLSTAMQSRLIHFELELDQPSWIVWATKKDIDYRIRSFIGFKSHMLNNFNPNHTDHTFACGRTWEFVSRLIKKYPDIPDNKLPLITGTVGEGAGREFYTFSKIFPDLPKIGDIIKNPTGIPVPDEMSVKWALSGTIGNSMTTDNAEKLMQFVERLDPEFMVLTLQGLHGRLPDLWDIPAIKSWMAKFSDEFF